MNIKESRTKLFIAAGFVCVLAIAGTVIFIRSNRQASAIPPMSSLEKARELSKGKKAACLADNKQAADAVKADDTYIGKDEEFSEFELTASSGIMDVPAGTNYDTTINTYANGLVNGTVAYDKDYGKYNYTIKKLPGAGEWEFVSMVACN